MAPHTPTPSHTTYSTQITLSVSNETLRPSVSHSHLRHSTVDPHPPPSSLSPSPTSPQSIHTIALTFSLSPSPFADHTHSHPRSPTWFPPPTRHHLRIIKSSLADLRITLTPASSPPRSHVISASSPPVHLYLFFVESRRSCRRSSRLECRRPSAPRPPFSLFFLKWLD
ncbi:hypothetical protein PIB30_003092 [Stylosanthes scabra]|uniref:Uncharacterized protein n=1 Tax=Stylosanthes scabra TaxID=79078 RepID=A0ABU6Y0J1_9FABA|nr:hypothetical protein [Stylosanthes scabra]